VSGHAVRGRRDEASDHVRLGLLLVAPRLEALAGGVPVDDRPQLAVLHNQHLPGIAGGGLSAPGAKHPGHEAGRPEFAVAGHEVTGRIGGRVHETGRPEDVPHVNHVVIQGPQKRRGLFPGQQLGNHGALLVAEGL